MIALDTNLLVYAHREESPHHQVATRMLQDLASSASPWAVPWPCLHEFLAVVTHPRIYRPPTPMPVALDAVVALAGIANLHLLSETSNNVAILTSLLEGGAVVGPKVHDARIAAICLGHGVTALWSADRDFSWFPSLTVRNPLIT